MDETSIDNSSCVFTPRSFELKKSRDGVLSISRIEVVQGGNRSIMENLTHKLHYTNEEMRESLDHAEKRIRAANEKETQK